MQLLLCNFYDFFTMLRKKTLNCLGPVQCGFKSTSC